MGQFSQDFASAHSLFAKRAAANQAGILSGDNPVQYSDTDPIRLWVIQLVIIVCFTQILALILGRIRQPRVIAEVIGGVLLGPSVMGQIPHFRDTIFPQQSMALLNLTANIGLVLFMFLVGMEIDIRVLKRNFRASATISVMGLIFPLGLGAAVGVGVYHQFVSPAVNFGYFLLFVAVAVGITAFPVLCRILTECKLLHTTVGVVTLSAGIGNDVVGWILLALTVSLVNAANGLTALYVLLTSVGFIIFLLYPVRWAIVWLARRTGSLEQGTPTALMMTVILLLVFLSAFFTDIIGIHAIFGAFLTGLIIPKENGFVISLVEKIEDLIGILLLPLYFTLSGLRTNLGLLNDGVTWGYIILICLVAFVTKFVPCGVAAKVFGFSWREAGAIGSLMSCKGLVELIVLNVGYQAKILDDRTFSMFVVHAVVLTFITTPLTLAFYPERIRVHLTALSHGPKPVTGDSEGTSEQRAPVDHANKTRFALVLDKLEQLPAAMTLAQLLHPFNDVAATAPVDSSNASDIDVKADSPDLPTLSKEVKKTATGIIELTLLRLIELTGRTSAVFRSTEAAALVHTDPVTSIFSTFAWLSGLGRRSTSAGQSSTLNTALEVVAWDEFTNVIGRHVEERKVEMLLVPWASTGSGTAAAAVSNQEGPAARNPFDGVFNRSASSADEGSTTQHDQISSVVYAEFIRKTFLTTPCDVALFVDRGSGRLSVDSALSTSSLQTTDTVLFLPFFGGPDDRLALNLLVQICSRNPGVKAIVVRIQRTDDDDESGEENDIEKEMVVHNTVSGADTVYGQHGTQTRLASDTADNILWETHSNAGLPRISFRVKKTSRPLRDVVDMVSTPSTGDSPASNELTTAVKTGANVVVLCGRSRQMAVEKLSGELAVIVKGTAAGAALASSVSRTLGDVGAAMTAVGARASLLVVQARIARS
ncbi:potassium:hydrogen antiporter [Marasmius fiardii PR-910]|nr:potassium:hydrogen antiporter [Marasmius fiardii PR-910]